MNRIVGIEVETPTKLVRLLAYISIYINESKERFLFIFDESDEDASIEIRVLVQVSHRERFAKTLRYSIRQ